jgi:hypothetical protein
MKNRLNEIAEALEGIRYEAGLPGWRDANETKRQVIELYRELNYMVCLVDVEEKYKEYLRGCMNKHFKQILRDGKLDELGIN